MSWEQKEENEKEKSDRGKKRYTMYLMWNSHYTEIKPTQKNNSKKRYFQPNGCTKDLKILIIFYRKIQYINQNGNSKRIIIRGC